jgi:extracellular factor (EF) 3-hydroxypalmitic acid methyl ester biosynthesis protein
MNVKSASSPTVLVIADDLKLVESLRGAFGSACQVFLSPSVESGLKRVENEQLCAVLINMGMKGLNPVAVVNAVRALHREVTIVGFAPPPVRPNGVTALPVLEGCEVVQLPVDWKDLRHLLESSLPAVRLNGTNGTNGHHPARVEAPAPVLVPAAVVVPPPPPITTAAPPPVALSAPAMPEEVPPSLPEIAPEPAAGVVAETPVALAESTDVPLEQGTAFTFLRDEAAQREQANRFEFKLPKAAGVMSGRILRLSPHFLVCEMLNPQQALAAGFVAEEATVFLARREAYQGPARLIKVVHTGQALIGEWALSAAWQTVSPASSASVMPGSEALQPFLQRIRVLGRIHEVFKAVVADVASVLEEARQCLDRVEMSIQPAPGQTHLDAQRALFPELSKDLFPVLDQVFGKFEEASKDIPPDLDAEYHSLVRQRLHPLMMCAPFIHHVYAKPLGFAGDYGALHKLMEDPYEGHTLYARLLNAWLVRSPAGDAYRHRIALLVDEMRAQARRCHKNGGGMRVLSIGCGAANEVVRYLELEELSHSSEFTLVDFHPDTLAFALAQVEKARQQHWRLARVTLVPQSIQGLVMDEARMRRKGLASLGPVARAGGYDFIYCTGLFDYFSDRVCRRLTQTMYHMLAPGGRLVLCNFAPANPIRQFMKYVLDWNLTHRTEAEMQTLVPPGARSICSVSPAGVETYLHIDKP